MQADSYRLIIKRGPEPGRVIELNFEQAKLGREVQNEIVINDREVSRSHLRLVRGPEGYTVEDLNSTNGTFINGKRINGAVLLKNGDLISLGETVTLGYEVIRAGMPTMPAPAADFGTPSSPPGPAAQPYQPAPLPPAAQPYQAPAAQPYQPAPQPYQPPPAPASPAAPYGQPPYGQAASGAPGAFPSAPGAAPGAPDPYGMPGPDPYYGQYGPGAAPAAGAFAGAPGGLGAVPGAPMPNDYDPYAMREGRSSGNSGRLVLIGCLGLMLLCCCASIVTVVAVDTLNLYCDIPVLNNILETLGLVRCVVAGG